MVEITKQKRNLEVDPKFAVLLLLVLGLVIYGVTDSQPYVDTSSAALNGALRTSTAGAFNEKENARAMAEWKSKTQASCQKVMDDAKGNYDLAARSKKSQAERLAMLEISLPKSVSGSKSSDHQRYEYCRNVFIDLGTNIGDSIGHFVDNALDVCSPMWKKATGKKNEEVPRPHVDVTDLKITHDNKNDNPLFKMLQSGMNDDSKEKKVSPETFCVYGMEGNPAFTERLQKLENYIMNMRPRPIRHLHIHTESVVTAVDGPTKLFLDKTSVKENFWGSSILSSQQDAQKSAKELGNGEVFSADVDGIALSTLVKNTALPFKPGASPDEEKGGTLIIKMDVEGAEYQVLKEVANSGVLCEYAKKGNRVIMIVEYHNMSITDAAERRREKAGHQEAKEKLSACGVEFGNLQASWH